MAKYKECWRSPIDSTVIGWIDTETGFAIPDNTNNRHYRIFQNWLLGLDEEGNPFDPPTGPQTADPAYTQPEIDAWVAAQALIDEIETNADNEINLGALAGKTYDQVDTYVDTQITDMASAKLVVARMARITLAIIKLMGLRGWV